MMTEQQVIDFVKAYKPIKSPYHNMSDVAYNARRCGDLAKKEYNLSEDCTRTIGCLYICENRPSKTKAPFAVGTINLDVLKVQPMTADNIKGCAPDNGKELVNQFATDMLKYCPEWNNREIAKKKIELSFAYMFGKTEDIQRLESDIEMLTEKLRSKQNGN